MYGITKSEVGDHLDKYVFLSKGNSITSLSGVEDILPGVRGVEGPQLLRLIDGSFVLYYDFFAVNNRSWGASKSDDLETWTEITPDPDFPAGVRHGSILIVTKQEAAAILEEYNTSVPSGWDDVPDVTVSYGAAAYDVDEGSSVTVTVELSTAPKRWVTVPVTLGGSATNNADYSGVPAYVTFSAAQTTATIILAATDDVTNDVDETVVLGFGALPDGFTAGVRPTATVTIIAADEAWTGLWYLDDGSGSVAVDSVGSNNGDLVGGASFTGDGLIGGAVGLDGSDDHVDIGAAVVDTTKSYTVSAYVRLDSSSGTQTVLSQDGNRVSGFFLQINNGRWAFAVPSADSNSFVAARASSSSGVLAGVWTHLVGVHDGEADQLRLYVNGEQAGTATFASPWSAAGSLVFGRGKHQGQSADFLDGRIDEVRTYDRALTSNEIAELYDAVPTGLWYLDDGSGSVAVDSVGSNNGDLGGGASFTGDGFIGGAVGLDGSDDHVDIGAAVVDTTKSYTVSAYVRLDSSSGTQTVLSQDGNRVSGFFLQIEDGRWGFVVPSADSDSFDISRAYSSSVVLAGVWTHLVGVHDGEADELRLYVNGEQAGTEDFASPWSAAGSLVFGRGKHQGQSVDFLDGRIDEVRTYDRALASNEIAELYDQNPVPDQDLVYLMAYFTGNSGILERMYYAYSVDALAWNNINAARPVFDAYDDTVNIRDPYMLKVNGKFHLVHTAGWDNKYVFHWESNDGITWSGANGQRSRAAGQINVVPDGNPAPNAWAPEFYWDGEKFYLFWSSKHWDLNGDGQSTGDEGRFKFNRRRRTI